MMSRFRVYCTDHEFGTLDIERNILGEIGAEVIEIQSRDPQLVSSRASDADALLNLYATLPREVLKEMPRLKVIVRYGVGVDTIDLQAATELGIFVANVPDYGVEEVASHAMALILGLARKVCIYDRAVRRGTWDVKMGKPIRRLVGQKVGLVGFGRIPTALVPKLQSLGFRVLAYDPYVTPEQMSRLGVEKRESLVVMAQEVDYLSVHVPLTPHTRHLIGREVLQAMKPSAFLINTSRGPVVDEQALTEALKDGRIAGAALDVMELEPPERANDLLRMEKVILTPHAAYYSEEAFVDLRTKAAQQIRDVLLGGIPKYLVNGEVLNGAV